MMRHSFLSAGISAQWAFGLVCVCGVILVIIAMLALMLLRGQSDLPRRRRPYKVLSRGKKRDRQALGQGEHGCVELRFVRIGKNSELRQGLFRENCWYRVGAGNQADFCLDAQDCNLAQVHFRMCIQKSGILVDAVDRETFVNGVPIRKLGVVQAENGGLIRAGSHEYRVLFAPCEEVEKERVT